MTVIALAPLPALVEALRAFPDAIATASQLSINDTARYSVKQGAKRITRELNFPSGYLNDTRLFIQTYATKEKLVAVAAGRGRATSLLRFAEGNPTPESTRSRGAGGVAVRVGASGGSKVLARAFVVRLRSGKSLTEDNFNMGLAIRLKPGETIQNRQGRAAKPIEIFKNVFLLYGPSVAQALDQVWPVLAPEVLAFLDTEFKRQLGVRLGT